MPPFPVSATANRFVAHWIADVLDVDESLEVSVLKGEAPNPNLLRRSLGRFQSLS